MLVIDFLLISVIVLCAYLGPMVLRRMGPGQRLYGWMIIADLALAIIALASRRSEGPNATADLIATIAVGGAVCLVFVPPALRSLARRALVADRLHLARWLVNAREHLQPGMGARQEGELISTIIEVRSGQVDAAIERLRERRDRVAEPAARRPIDERIIMTYLYARRWEDAIGWLEDNLEPGAASPQLAVELVRAYCELGRLDEAALLVERIEGVHSSAEEPIWVLLVSRARLVFLAFLGRIAAVEAILGPRGPLGSMPEAARLFWYGLVRLKAGDRSGARSSLEKAAALSGRDGRARELAQHTLSRIDEPGVAGPLDVSPGVSELADRLSRLAEDAPADLPAAGSDTGRPARRTRPPRLSGVRLREIPVTASLIAANLAAALAVFIHWGTTSDLGALIQAGANVKAAVAEGEVWRLASSMFLHVGLLHLGINVYGLWVLGRLVEQMVGSLRFFVIYVGAGLTGSAASYLFGGATTSVGASGAVFGLLGAAVVELAIHRKSYPRRWSGALLGMLLFLGAANVAIGFIYEVIDQSAHLGGLVGGALLGAALSRKHRFARKAWLRPLVMALAVVAAAALGYGAVAATTSDFADTIARYPRVTRQVGGITVVAPAPWKPDSDTSLYDESLVVLVQLKDAADIQSLDDVMKALEAQREYERKEGAKGFGLVGAHTVEDRLLPVPPPWISRELEVRTEGGLVGEQRLRIAVVAREKDGRLWLGSIYYPASLADALAPAVADMLRTAR
ncbi:MAG TPA: rhomboid family intramembrane serine protease [Kofleriaceae bacterium]|nr:rhomboid family intramembrane serine protease [Kofleriaceae bacterium]